MKEKRTCNLIIEKFAMKHKRTKPKTKLVNYYYIFQFTFHHRIIIYTGIPISFPLVDFERPFLSVDLLTIWYSGIIFHDLLNDCLEVYQGSRPVAPSAPKGNRRFGVLKVFSLKHKANQILPATTEKIKLCLFKKIASCYFRL